MDARWVVVGAMAMMGCAGAAERPAPAKLVYTVSEVPVAEAEAPLYRVEVGFLRGDETLSRPVVMVAEGQWATVSISSRPMGEPDRRYVVWEETDAGPRVAVREEYDSGAFLAVRCERGRAGMVDLHLRTWLIDEGGSTTEKEVRSLVDPDIEHTFPSDR